MLSMNIVLIGGGNMAEAIIAGLIGHGYPASQISVIDRNSHKCEHLKKRYDIHADTSNNHALTHADIIFIAVKPQDAKTSCCMLASPLTGYHPLIISVMAGITTTMMGQWLGEPLAIIRAAPNTPALIQAGATGLFANPLVTETQKKQAESLLSAIGYLVWLNDEAYLDIVTALSGSGPAYYFYFMASMQDAAINMGLPPEIARTLTLQTAYGAAKLAIESNNDFETLRQQVTSKGGTTEAALAHMMQHELHRILEDAMKAAQQRSIALSQTWIDSTKP